MVHWICNFLFFMWNPWFVHFPPSKTKMDLRLFWLLNHLRETGSLTYRITYHTDPQFTNLPDSDNNLTVLVCCSCPYTHSTSCAINITNLYTTWTDEEVNLHCPQARNKLTSTEGCYHGSKAFACSGWLKVVQAWYSQVSIELSHQQLVRIPQL